MNSDVAHQTAQLMLQFVTVSLVLSKVMTLQIVLAFVRRLFLNLRSLVLVQ
jgi:hypothetical protein